MKTKKEIYILIQLCSILLFTEQKYKKKYSDIKSEVKDGNF